MYILNIARAIKSCQSMKMRDFQKCYKWIGFSKENSYYIQWNAWKKKYVVACEQINGKNTWFL